MSDSQYDFLLQIAEQNGVTVWLARETNVGISQLVTIKQVPQNLIPDPATFRMTINASSQLNHPVIHRVHDVGEENRSQFMVSELIRGETLALTQQKLMSQKLAMEPSMAIQLVSHLAGALQLAHRMVDGQSRPLNLFHANLNPAAVYITYDGGIKVADFDGITRPTAVGSGSLTNSASSYMSPEQCLGGAVDFRSDIYRLGIILWELLTGQLRFDGVDEFDIMEAIAEEETPPASRYNRAVPPFLDAIVRKAVAKNPGQRFGTCGHMQQALEKVIGRTGGNVGAAQFGGMMAKTFPRRLRHWNAIKTAEFQNDDGEVTRRAAVLFGLAADDLQAEAPPPSSSFEPRTQVRDERWEPVTQEGNWDPSALAEKLESERQRTIKISSPLELSAGSKGPAHPDGKKRQKTNKVRPPSSSVLQAKLRQLEQKRASISPGSGLSRPTSLSELPAVKPPPPKASIPPGTHRPSPPSIAPGNLSGRPALSNDHEPTNVNLDMDLNKSDGWTTTAAEDIFQQLDNILGSGDTLGTEDSGAESEHESTQVQTRPTVETVPPMNELGDDEDDEAQTNVWDGNALPGPSDSTIQGDIPAILSAAASQTQKEPTNPWTDDPQTRKSPAAELMASSIDLKPALPPQGAASLTTDVPLDSVPSFDSLGMNALKKPGISNSTPATPSLTGTVPPADLPKEIEEESGPSDTIINPTGDSAVTMPLDLTKHNVPKPRGMPAVIEPDAVSISDRDTGPPKGAPAAQAMPAPLPFGADMAFEDDDEDDDEDEDNYVEPFSIETILDASPASTSVASAALQAKPVAEIVRLRGDIAMGTTVLRSGQTVSPHNSGLQVQLQDNQCTLTIPPQMPGWVRRTGAASDQAPVPEGPTRVLLNIGDVAELRQGAAIYRVRLYRPPVATRPRLFGRQMRGVILTGIAVHAVAAFMSIALLGGALFAFEYMGKLGMQLTVPATPEQAEIFAEGKLEKPKDKAKAKPKPRPKPKPKPRRKITRTKPADPTEQKVTVPKAVRAKLAAKQSKRRGGSKKKNILNSLKSPHQGEGKKITDVVTNIDAANKNRGSSSAFNVGGDIKHMAGDINVGKGGGGDFGKITEGTEAASKSGKLDKRAGAGSGKVRGKVRGVSALAKIQGSLSRGDIQKTINRHIGKIQGCYERALLGNPNLSGKITVGWTITTSGGVSGARQASSTMGNAKVSNCVIGVVKRMKFPKPKGGTVSIRYPFIFRASN